jgi:hypothetical protein
MKKVILVLGIIALLAAGTAAFAADGGHTGSTVTAPAVGAPKEVPSDKAAELSTALGAEVKTLEDTKTVVSDATKDAVEANLKRDVLPEYQDSNLIPVVFPALKATLEFDADNKAAVAFGADKSDISNKLELASGETVSGIKSQIRLFLIKNSAGDLVEVADFSVVEDNDGVYFAFVLDGSDAISPASARAAAKDVTIEPVVLRVKSVDTGKGSSGGGCDAGFSGVAAMLALAGAAIMSRRARG